MLFNAVVTRSVPLRGTDRVSILFGSFAAKHCGPMTLFSNLLKTA